MVSMGSMCEPERKRCHLSSLSPTAAAATAKMLPFLPISEDKKLDVAVLEFQNQKLKQKLETQKVEHNALKNKFFQLEERQQPYDSTLTMVKKSWEQLINDLESCSSRMRESSCKLDSKFTVISEVARPSIVEDVFLSRFMQTGATESSSTYNCANQMEEDRKNTSDKAKSILQNIVTAINNLWSLKDGLQSAVLKELPGDGSWGQRSSIDLEVEVKNLRLAFSELHLKHKSLTSEFQSHQDFDAKNKAELKRLKDLNEGEQQLKLILEMYRHESIDSREVEEARDSEYRAWVHVQSLKSSFDEHNLELRVKNANEAEARSQQRLAAAEADIANLRQKLEASKREICKLSYVLKSKNEENEVYLSEIETIGQAYDDMQTQNQHLLQQITERDDYNTKLVLEGVRARQKKDTLFLEKLAMEREIQQANASIKFYDIKAARIEDQLKFCSDQIQRLSEDKLQRSVTLENTQRKLLDVQGSSQQSRDTVEDVQSKVGSIQVTCMELQVELERERFGMKRIEEELEVTRRKVSNLKAQSEGSSVIEKLQQELGEYREIVKCRVCQQRTKEVVITKCYHLCCNPCIQKTVESRHRKCPLCAASFGPNDVKPVYL